MAALTILRASFHDRLARQVLGFRKGVPNIADSGSAVSKSIASSMLEIMKATHGEISSSGQTLGKEFGDLVCEFLGSSFEKLHHIRPGKWRFSTSQASAGIGAYEQYEHLGHIQRILDANPELKTALGGDYLVTPDIVVGRMPVHDDEINATDKIVEPGRLARLSPLREGNLDGSPPILHASISCKWTMRSDRSQNTRTEALNLIRNRKGSTPHISVVTMEPLPTRLASIALGTGDVDCTYHGALYELREAIEQVGATEQAEMLANLIDGRRLRDISDLPLDLAT